MRGVPPSSKAHVMTRMWSVKGGGGKRGERIVVFGGGGCFFWVFLWFSTRRHRDLFRPKRRGERSLKKKLFLFSASKADGTRQKQRFRA